MQCDSENQSGKSSGGLNSNLLYSIKNSIGNYQDDKDILTTGLVFNDETLNTYIKGG